MKNDVATQVAEALININAVGFVADHPITFKSGIISPMYIDNRKFPFYPQEWKKVLNGFLTKIKNSKTVFDVLAGIETAGIPHSAALGVLLEKPSVFVRKAAKDHGTKKMIEGGEVKDKIALLIEDLVTTGGSSLHGVRELRTAGATVNDCYVIVSYGFPEAKTNFDQEQVKLTALTDIETILTVAEKRGVLTADHKKIVKKWYQNPWAFGH